MGRLEGSVLITFILSAPAGYIYLSSSNWVHLHFQLQLGTFNFSAPTGYIYLFSSNWVLLPFQLQLGTHLPFQLQLGTFTFSASTVYFYTQPFHMGECSYNVICSLLTNPTTRFTYLFQMASFLVSFYLTYIRCSPYHISSKVTIGGTTPFSLLIDHSIEQYVLNCMKDKKLLG